MLRFSRTSYFQIGILVLAFSGLYFPFILSLVQDWETNDNFSHGYFIPFIALYMIHAKKKELQETTLVPNNWGLALIALGLIQLVVAKIGSEYFLQRTSMVIVLFGILLFLTGKEFTKKVCIPVLYLLFMVPIPAIIWNKITFPMQLFASSLTENIIYIMGIPIFREGNILHLTETSLEVVDACSGLRSLTTMLALSAAFAYISNHSNWKKWMLFFSAIPIAIFVNISRLTLTVSLATYFGEKIAQGFLHDFSGWLVFFLGLIMLMGLHVLFSFKKT